MYEIYTATLTVFQWIISSAPSLSLFLLLSHVHSLEEMSILPSIGMITRGRAYINGWHGPMEDCSDTHITRTITIQLYVRLILMRLVKSCSADKRQIVVLCSNVNSRVLSDGKIHSGQNDKKQGPVIIEQKWTSLVGSHQPWCSVVSSS
jgi:hypothetical protein